MLIVNRIIKTAYLVLLVLIPSLFCIADEGIVMPGFGIQPIRVDEDMSAKILIQKTLGNIRYKLTPGDTYKIVIVIEETFSQPLILDENYKLELPFIGTMDVKGMYFSELRQEIIKRIKAERIVDFVDFVLVAPALFEVFIYGGVENPGYVTLTPINTLWEAIVLAKGLKKGGSYRQIQLTRNGETRTYDLVKFVRDGDLEQNPRVEPGDRIYVPHAEIIAEIKGQVLYPEKYELLPGETLYDLLLMAGGYIPDAIKTGIEVFRMNEDGSLYIDNVDDSQAARFSIRMADVINVKSSLENSDMLVIEGALYGKPTKATEPQKIPDKLLVFNAPFVRGITLLQVLETFGGPSPLAEAEKSFIIRNKTGERIYVDVKALWDTRNPDMDVILEPEDHIVVPMMNIMVIVAGEVNRAGAFPFFNNTVVADYILLAGGIDFEKADPKGIYFIDKAGNQTRVTLETEVFPGSLIYVDRSALEKTTFVVGKVAIIVGLIAALTTIAVNIADLYLGITN